MLLNHNKLITHGIGTTDPSQGIPTAVLFDLAAFKAAGSEAELTGVPLFQLADIHPEALNLLLSSVHLYQMLIRNMLGLDKFKTEVLKATRAQAVGPVFSRELCGWIDELQALNAVTRTLVIKGQEASDNQLTGVKST